MSLISPFCVILLAHIGNKANLIQPNLCISHRFAAWQVKWCLICLAHLQAIWHFWRISRNCDTVQIFFPVISFPSLFYFPIFSRSFLVSDMNVLPSSLSAIGVALDSTALTSLATLMNYKVKYFWDHCSRNISELKLRGTSFEIYTECIIRTLKTMEFCTIKIQKKLTYIHSCSLLFKLV